MPNNLMIIGAPQMNPTYLAATNVPRNPSGNQNNLAAGFMTTTTDANTVPFPVLSDAGPPFHPLQRIMYMMVR